MASNAFSRHLHDLLRDADHIDDTTSQLPAEIMDWPARVAALDRAVVVICVSAWEAYIEELVRKCVVALRPEPPALGLWPVMNASVLSQIGRFNTPNFEQVRSLLSDTIGFQAIQSYWVTPDFTSAEAVQRLSVAMDLRHKIAHGANPRPVIDPFYASGLPDFFRQLSRCTDDAVRGHLLNVLGIANPWPP